MRLQASGRDFWTTLPWGTNISEGEFIRSKIDVLGLVRKFDVSKKDETLVGKVALILVMIVGGVVGGGSSW